MKLPKLKPVVGIISYLPRDTSVRTERINRLRELISQVDTLLNLPIIIVAQNWNDDQVINNSPKKKLVIYHYSDPLGIIGARRELRKIFLDSSQYDYLIMLDDDCKLKGDAASGKAFINQLESKRNGWGDYRTDVLKLFAISKYIFSKIDYPDGGADCKDSSKRFFEDALLIRSLAKHFQDARINFVHYNFEEVSDSAWDIYNTGWHEVYSDEWTRHDTGDTTRFLAWNSTLDEKGNIVWHWPAPGEVERGTTWTEGVKRKYIEFKNKVSIIIPTRVRPSDDWLAALPRYAAVELILVGPEFKGLPDFINYIDAEYNLRGRGIEASTGKYIYVLPTTAHIDLEGFAAFMSYGLKKAGKYDPAVIVTATQGKVTSLSGKFLQRAFIDDYTTIDSTDDELMAKLNQKPHISINSDITTFVGGV